MTLEEMKERKKELEKQKDELDRQIKDQEKAEKKKKQDEVSQKIWSMSDEEKSSMLKLIQHDRTSCSDDNVCNGFGSADYGARCRKCHLIEILNGEWGGRFDFELEPRIWEV